MAVSYIGEVILFSGFFAIEGYAECNGALLSISSNYELYSILGTSYGGDGKTTFALPDLRGRTPIQENPDGALGLPSRRIGEQNGSPLSSLKWDSLPPHEHDFIVQGSQLPANQRVPTSNYYALTQKNSYSSITNTTMVQGETDKVGGGKVFSVQNPFLCLRFLISINGISGNQGVALSEVKASY